jgi:hypothetical protein
MDFKETELEFGDIGVSVKNDPESDTVLGFVRNEWMINISKLNPIYVRNAIRGQEFECPFEFLLNLYLLHADGQTTPELFYSKYPNGIVPKKRKKARPEHSHEG